MEEEEVEEVEGEEDNALLKGVPANLHTCLLMEEGEDKNAARDFIAVQQLRFVRILKHKVNHHHGDVGGKEDCAMKNENVVPLWFAPLWTARVAISHQEWELARKGHQNQNVVKEAVNAAMNKNVV